MSRNQTIIAVVLAVLVAAGGGAYYFLKGHNTAPTVIDAGGAPAEQQNGPLPTPVVLVINKAAIMQLSKAGQDVQRQAQGYAMQAKGELQGQIAALESEGNALKAQAASLSPEARQSRVAAFEAKRAALQEQIAKRDTRIKTGLAGAQKKMETALAPILKQIMAERKANLIVDHQAVIFATDNNFDISREAITRLDAVLPAVKVEIPAG